MTSDIQAVLDMAASLTEGTMDETQTEAIVPLGRFQDLQNMVYQWRKAGGRTSEEMDAVIDPVCGSGNIYVTPQAVIDLIRTNLARHAGHIAAHAARIHNLIGRLDRYNEAMVNANQNYEALTRRVAKLEPVHTSGLNPTKDQVSSRPCQTCHHPEWLHAGAALSCCGQNAADTGGCDCKAFVPAPDDPVCARVACGHPKSRHRVLGVECGTYMCGCLWFVPSYGKAIG